MPNRQGYGAVLLAIVALVTGRLFGVIELFVVGTGLFALVVLSVAMAHARPILLTVDRRVTPELLHVGDNGRVELRVANMARWGTSPLTLWEPVAGMGGATLKLAPLRRREVVAANYRLPALQRGVVVFGPLTIERRDPFGLATKRCIVAGTHEVVVLPAYHRLQLPPGVTGTGPLGDQLRMRSLARGGNEFHSLREYVDGDDLRHIHWRASARSDSLKVREVEPEGLRRCTVALDTTSDEYSAEGFERAVSAAATAVFAATHASLRLRIMVGNDKDLRNTESSVAMLTLAKCSPGAGPQAMSFTAPAGDGLGLVVVITGSPRSAAVSAARRCLSPSDVLVIVACSSCTGTSSGLVVDATSTDSFISSWAVLTGSRPFDSTRRPMSDMATA